MVQYQSFAPNSVGRSFAVRNVYAPIGSVLSCLLVLMVPRLTNGRFAAPNPATVTPPVTITAQQFAQDDSNDPNTLQQPDQPGDDNSNASGDNYDQPNPQPGDESGDDPSQANPADGNGDDSAQMNASPGDSNSDNADQSNQGSNDSQDSENSSDSQ